MMMLPDKKRLASLALSKIQSSKAPEMPENTDKWTAEDPDDHSVALTDCMRRFCEYMTSNNHKEMGEALHDAFAIMESMPHSEYSEEE